MPPPAQDLRNARAAVEQVLDEMGVRGFVYTIEQKEDGWTLSVECAAGGEWQSARLRVDPVELGACLRDAGIREKLRAQWEPHLRSCDVRR